jgi:hypothetical protein
VATENTRPKLNEDLSEDIRTLIRSCWQKDENLRPKFETIVELLTAMEVEG